MLISDIFKISSDRERAIFDFITAKNPFKKPLAAIRAIYKQKLLNNSSNLSKAFNFVAEGQLTLRQHFRHLIAEAEAIPAVHLIYDSVNKALAYGSWQKAKKRNDFSIFAPKFQKIVDSVRKIAEFKVKYLGFPSAYDARLDRLTPGMNQGIVETIIDELMPFRTRLQSIAKSFCNDHEGKFRFSDEIQIDVLKTVLNAIGLDEKNTVLHNGDYHPLAFLFDNKIHITFDLNRDDIVQTILDVIHEAGHGLYRLHMNGTVRQNFLNMIDTHYNGPDESTALLFDQYIARSPEFAEFLYNTIKETVKGQDLAYPSLQEIYRRLISDDGRLKRSKAAPSRYPFFLFQYHEIAKKLFSREAEASDIPELWEKASIKYHGYHVEDDSDQNALQDPHWCSGELGRFAGGYLPGIMMAAQMYATIKQTRPHAIQAIKRGDFSGVLDWCIKKVYSQDKQRNFQDFIKSATGRALSTRDYLEIEFSRPENTMIVGKNLNDNHPNKKPELVAA